MFPLISLHVNNGKTRACAAFAIAWPWYAEHVANETSTNNAKEFGFKTGDVIQEWMWDDDVDEDIRESIADITGTDLEDEDYNGPVDGAILWWRDGDDEDTLSDTIVDASTPLEEGAALWVITPKPGREGAASSFTINNAAKAAGMNCAANKTVSRNWNGIKLNQFGNGEH